MKNAILRLFPLLSIILIVNACSSSKEDVALPPSELSYTANQIEIEEGQKASSVVPTVKGTKPFTFSITTNPATPQITIDNQGIITISESLGVGTYRVSVTVSNSANRVTFSDVLTVTVRRKVLPPAALVYAPNQVEVDFGRSGSSAMPTLQGTAPFNFSLTSSPQTDKISINNQGVISYAADLGVGTYSLNVAASNSAGNVTFNNAFRLTVKPVAPSSLVYAPNSVEVSAGTAIASSVPTVQGTQPITYTIATAPVTDRITIDNRGVISVANNTTAGIYNISVTARNEVGSATFPNVFTVTVRSATTMATAPSGLAYSPNMVNVIQGTAVSTTAPTISGTSPFTFSIVSANTGNGQITINASTGVVSVGANTPVGAYLVSITVTNAGGSATFMNVLTLNVTAPVVAVSFAKDIQPFLQVCGNCHTYNTFASARTNADRMLDRIQRPVGSAGFMPQSGTPLTRAQIDLFKKWIDDGLKE